MEIFSGKPQTAKKSFLQRYYEKLYNPPGDSGTNETSDKSRIHKIAHKGTLKMWGMALGREFVSNFGEHKQNLQGDGKIFAVKKGKKKLGTKSFLLETQQTIAMLKWTPMVKKWRNKFSIAELFRCSGAVHRHVKVLA